MCCCGLPWCFQLPEVYGVACRGTYFARCVVSRSSPLAAQLQLPHGVPALLVAKHGAVLGKAHIDKFGGADIWEEEVRPSCVGAVLVHGCFMLQIMCVHDVRERPGQVGCWLCVKTSMGFTVLVVLVACRAVLWVCLQVLSYLRRFKALSAGGSADSGTSRAASQHGGSSDDGGSGGSDEEVSSGLNPSCLMTLPLCRRCVRSPPSRQFRLVCVVCVIHCCFEA